MGRRNRGGNLAGVAQGAYDEAAAFGRFMAIVGMVTGCIIGSLLIVFGIYFIFKKPDVTAAKTSTSTANGAAQPPNYTAIGAIMILLGIFIMGGSILHWYIVTRFKMAAAASGTGDAIGFADAAFDTSDS